MNGNLILLTVLGSPLFAYLLGIYLGKVLRMKDHGWKIGLILATVAMGSAVTFFYWPPKRGIDLSGGVILVYEVDQEKTAPAPGDPDDQTTSSAERQEVDMGALVQALRRRINPTGVKEVVIREYGANQVEIIIPNVTENEIDEIKRTIIKSGYLKFQIVADPQDHARIIELANEANSSEDADVRAANQVRDDNNRVVAEWVPIALEEGTPEGDPKSYKVDVIAQVRREVDVDGEPHAQALMIIEPDTLLRVDGSHLRSVTAGFDNMTNPSVNFRMNLHGARLFGALTGSNLPDKQSDHYRLLGIVMDDELLSAPRIMSRITDDGQITGKFTQKEVDFLVNVLRAGRLPAVLKDEPISENTISPLLGEDTIRKGSFAIGISLLAVLVFMLIYYQFCGIIACLALITNLILIVALMILISAAFTLPGLAGLVLTVGMSVDANVLVFERIREELNRGAALHMAIRNGFARATTTIVDANLTTLITALVLYAIGTDQIRGFAVTLILGIVMSMYTAIFCSRVIFDIAERKRWITQLGMLHIVGATKIDFVGKRKIAAVLSVCLIAAGLAAAGIRGEQIFDIDFLGGTSVQAVFRTPMQIDDVRDKASELADDVSVTEVSTEEYGKGSVYKIDTSLPKVEELEKAISETFRDDRGSLLVTHTMEFTSPSPVKETPIGASPDTDTNEAPDQTSQWDSPNRPIASEKMLPLTAGLTGRQPILLAMADDPPVVDEETDAPVAEDPPVVDEETDVPVAEDPPVVDEETDAPVAEDPPVVDEAVDEPGAEATPTEEAAPPDESSESADGEETGEETTAETPFSQSGTQEQAADRPEANVPVEEAPGDQSPSPEEAPTVPAPARQEATPAAVNDSQTATEDESPSPESSPPEAEQSVEILALRTETEVTFKERISQEALADRILRAAQDLEITPPQLDVELKGQADDGAQTWLVKLSSGPSEATTILDKLQSDIQGTPYLLSSSTIGSAVAGKTQNAAVAALIFSLVGIVAYIWIRFQRVMYGLAAVVALLHDVAFTIGAVAISLWLSKALGFLLVDEFKISLPVVAALLTIIGYSLNDTIVVFDRIREVKGKSPELTDDIVNTSINQTLSRTLLTSTTTLLVVLILYAFGGQGIHGFAFALLVGVMVGTYSSIFVASPVLLWMSRRWSAPVARRKTAVQ